MGFTATTLALVWVPGAAELWQLLLALPHNVLASACVALGLKCLEAAEGEKGRNAARTRTSSIARDAACLVNRRSGRNGVI